jgi:hypothetical protein
MVQCRQDMKALKAKKCEVHKRTELTRNNEKQREKRRLHVQKINLGTLAETYIHRRIYDTIHQAPTRIATRTSRVRMLAPALSPVVTELKVMGVLGTLAPAPPTVG